MNLSRAAMGATPVAVEEAFRIEGLRRRWHESEDEDGRGLVPGRAGKEEYHRRENGRGGSSRGRRCGSANWVARVAPMRADALLCPVRRC